MAIRSASNRLPDEVLGDIFLQLSPPPPLPVSSLVEDAFLAVHEHRRAQHTVCAAAAVNKAWARCARPVLFDWVVIPRRWREGELLSLLSKLEADHHGRRVRSLTIFLADAYDWTDADDLHAHDSVLSAVIAACPRLLHLTFGRSLHLFPATSQSLASATGSLVSLSIGDVGIRRETGMVHDYAAYAAIVQANPKLTSLALLLAPPQRSLGPPPSIWPAAGLPRLATVAIGMTDDESAAAVVADLCASSVLFPELTAFSVDFPADYDANRSFAAVRLLTSTFGPQIRSLSLGRILSQTWLRPLLASCTHLRELFLHINALHAGADLILKPDPNKDQHLRHLARVGIRGVDFVSLECGDSFWLESKRILDFLSRLVTLPSIHRIDLLDALAPSGDDFQDWVEHPPYPLPPTLSEQLDMYLHHRLEHPIAERDYGWEDLTTDFSDLIPGRIFAHLVRELSLRARVDIVDAQGVPLTEHADYTTPRVEAFCLRFGLTLEGEKSKLISVGANAGSADEVSEVSEQG